MQWTWVAFIGIARALARSSKNGICDAKQIIYVKLLMILEVI